jgi:hypothetical protein
MNPMDVIGGRAEVTRRLVILDDDYRIISSQDPLPCEGRFHFAADAQRLPPDLERTVKASTASWNDANGSETRIVLNDAICMRVFPLLGWRIRRIGVLFERYRLRATDV